mmetsp:Transcript_4236/g.13678  ORF Transcript_4236/g.13678 Transcript_4236/m.13678 type:complete len:273 (-) Transcript_4236:1304-2122(-)
MSCRLSSGPGLEARLAQGLGVGLRLEVGAPCLRSQARSGSGGASAAGAAPLLLPPLPLLSTLAGCQAGPTRRTRPLRTRTRTPQISSARVHHARNSALPRSSTTSSDTSTTATATTVTYTTASTAPDPYRDAISRSMGSTLSASAASSSTYSRAKDVMSIALSVPSTNGADAAYTAMYPITMMPATRDCTADPCTPSAAWLCSEKLPTSPVGASSTMKPVSSILRMSSNTSVKNQRGLYASNRKRRWDTRLFFERRTMASSTDPTAGRRMAR